MMRTVLVPGWVMVLLVCGCQSGSPLFNGHDLTGWVEVGSNGAWSASDGVLKCNGLKTEYAWLSTADKYDDFELTCQWRLEAEGNSGIFLRAPDRQGRTSMRGLEIQIRDDTGDQTLDDVSGAVFRRIPAAGKFSRPVGQWNDLRITMRGRRLRIELNRHLVSDTDIDTVKPREGDPPMSAIPGEGYIGLQNHGTPAEFRNIRLRRL